MKRKRCACCEEEIPTSHFYRYVHNRDGLSSYCKKCSNEKTKQYRRTAKGRKARDEYNAQYAKSERGREAHRRYVNSERGRATRKAYYKRMAQRREEDE